MHSILELVLILLLAAVVSVAFFRKLQLPGLLGYLAVGMAFGPHALGIAGQTDIVRMLAEWGIVFLMFSIGLEFSLPKVRSMGREVFGMGFAQVLLTVMPVVGLAFVASEWVPLSWQSAVALGGALAMSSTAIVSKLLTERGELNTPHGRAVFGVLLFQDLAVVPLLILVPALGGPTETMAESLGLAAVKAVVVLTFLLFFGQKVLRAWFLLVARRRSQELFMLNLLLVTLGLAWMTERAGLSLALGAFVAGMLISETEFRYQVEADIKPFRDVLLGLFFVTVGMLLDLTVVFAQGPLVLALLVLPILFKLLIITLLAKGFGLSTGEALRTGVWLSQAGEFGFVLLDQASGLHLIDATLMQPVLAAMVLSMIVAPFLIQKSDVIVLRFVSSEWMNQSLALHRIAAKSMSTDRHLIICGFGRCGQNIAAMMEADGVQYVALDLDPERVRAAAAARESVVFGDAARRESLMAAGLARACAVVITYVDTQSALRVLNHVRHLAAHVPVLIRTRDDSDLERLRMGGATEVVPDVAEGSLMLASHALALAGVPLNQVAQRVHQVRDGRYSLLRGHFLGADDAAIDEGSIQIRLLSVVLPPAAHAVGRPLGDYIGDFSGVEVAALRRREHRDTRIDPDLCLEAGDILVLRGEREALALAEDRLLGRT